MWVVLLGLTAIKEFYYDTHFEIPVQDISGGTKDFISYQIGAAIGLAMSWFKIVAHPAVMTMIQRWKSKQLG